MSTVRAMRARIYRAMHYRIAGDAEKILKIVPHSYPPNQHIARGKVSLFVSTMQPFSSLEQSKEHAHACWKCGTVNDKDRLFCHRIDCNAILPVTEKDVNFFETLGFCVDFRIDEKKLDAAFKELQKKLHPDKFGQSEKRQKDLSTQSSSLVNSAYTVLKSPVDRAFYMIFLLFKRDIYEEESLNQDTGLMIEMFDLREQIEDSRGDPQAMKELHELTNKKFEEEMKSFDFAIQRQSESEAVLSATRMKYFAKMLEELSQ